MRPKGATANVGTVKTDATCYGRAHPPPGETGALCCCQLQIVCFCWTEPVQIYVSKLERSCNIGRWEKVGNSWDGSGSWQTMGKAALAVASIPTHALHMHASCNQCHFHYSTNGIIKARAIIFGHLVIIISTEKSRPYRFCNKDNRIYTSSSLNVLRISKNLNWLCCASPNTATDVEKPDSQNSEDTCVLLLLELITMWISRQESQKVKEHLCWSRFIEHDDVE